MKRTLSEAAQVLGGRLSGEDHPYGAVSTDSRTLGYGALFVALRGPINPPPGAAINAQSQRSAGDPTITIEAGLIGPT